MTIVRPCARLQVAGDFRRSVEIGKVLKQSDLYRQNAENCMQMAEAAQGEPAYNLYKRMEAA
jgi:hypothetical protein